MRKGGGGDGGRGGGVTILYDEPVRNASAVLTRRAYRTDSGDREQGKVFEEVSREDA